MICRKQHWYMGRGQITNLLEINVDLDTWEQIQLAAMHRKTTYSWIMRYCLFRLIRRQRLQCPRLARAMDFHSDNIKTKPSGRKEDTHRAIISLYGTDEHYIKEAALCLGISITRLVRIALDWFLPMLLQGMEDNDERIRVNILQFFWFGIKISKELNYLRRNSFGLKLKFQHIRFGYDEYWNQPISFFGRQHWFAKSREFFKTLDDRLAWVDYMIMPQYF